tara:strand:- start:29102 stop:30109 length:1008 start_codon:yes stop_codon:yes gene_type:complete
MKPSQKIPYARTPIRKRTNATERKGVNYIRDLVDDANCVFREVDRAGDYGHDAFVLLVDGEAVTSVEVALQIKAGRSFCRKDSCRFSATPAQLGFWANHGLTTLGVVYDPDANCAWWIDLTEAAKERRQAIGNQTIIIPKELWNRFDEHGFQNVLIPGLLGSVPRLSLAAAVEWCNSHDFNTHNLGARVLITRHRESALAWETVFSHFRQRGADSSFEIIRGLIRIMGHTDEGYYGNEVPWDIRTRFQQEVMRFGKDEFVELLKIVEDGDFERGGIGWGILALIPPHPEGIKLLNDIAADDDIGELVRYNAESLLMIHRDDPHFWTLWRPTRPYY